MERARRTPPPTAAAADPRCVLCVAFRATWDPERPRECTAFGFRSREYPAAVVRRLSGEPCTLYRPRPGAR